MKTIEQINVYTIGVIKAEPNSPITRDETTGCFHKGNAVYNPRYVILTVYAEEEIISEDEEGHDE